MTDQGWKWETPGGADGPLEAAAEPPNTLEAGAATDPVKCPVDLGERTIWMRVVGEPKPGGSKRAFRNPATGRIVVTEDSKNKGWRQAVAEVGEVAMADLGGGILLDPLAVRFTFVRPRPKGHYGSGRNAGVVKGSAPSYPATRPDVLKLARAAEDALTGIVWRDDAQIVTELLLKRWGEPAGCEIVVACAGFVFRDYRVREEQG